MKSRFILPSILSFLALCLTTAVPAFAENLLDVIEAAQNSIETKYSNPESIARKLALEQLEKIATRRKVETPTVESEMLEDGMGYVRLVEFDDVTTNQFLEAMDELYANGMKGLILDLRGNPGGNLSTVVQIAQNLLPKGTIVYTEDKKQNRDTYTSKGNKEIKIPMVVLVDMNSASASEILAGAIQDYGKGTLVGTKTFGKGIVQSIIPMRDGSAIKITVSGYFTPKGRNIHKVGIEPDIVCEFDSERYYDADNPVDNQLEKAKEVLKEKMR